MGLLDSIMIREYMKDKAVWRPQEMKSESLLSMCSCLKRGVEMQSDFGIQVSEPGIRA